MTAPRHTGPWTALAGGAVALLLAAVTLGTLVVVALTAPRAGRLQEADLAVIRFTLEQALLSAALSCLLAVPLARALVRRRFPGRRLLVLLLGAPFILPVIVAILGLLAVWGRSGLAGRLAAALGLGPFDIYGLPGVVLAHVFFNLPLVTRLLLLAWQAVPAEHFRLAEQLSMSPAQLRRHLERPILRAVLPGAFATVFLLALTSFAVALTLGGGPRATTIEVAIYQAFRFDFDLGRAALLALVQFGLCALAAGMALAVARPGATGAGLIAAEPRWRCPGRVCAALDGAVIAASALFLLLPLVMLLADGLPGLQRLPVAPLTGAVLRSLAVALAAALMALGAALALGQAIVAGRAPGPRLLEGAGYLPLAASPMVIGTGAFILLFPLLDPARAALAVTALVNALMALPFVLRALLPALQDAERDFGRLADSLDMRGRARFRLLTWPRIRPAAGFATGLAAALSMGDLGVIALFADADRPTLPLLLYRLMGAYRMDQAAAAALILVVLALGLFVAFDRLGRNRHAGP